MKAQLSAGQRHMRSMLVYARLLGQAWNVDIKFGNVATACTDGKTIVLPPLDLGSEEDAQLMEGLIDHEAGVHLRFTDFELGAKRLKNASGITKALANVLEDVWGERENARSKPGCARTIQRALEIMVSRGLFGGPKAGAHVAADLVNTLLHGLRSRMLGQTILEPTFAAHRAALESKIGAANTQALWQTACKVESCVSTDQAIDLAREIEGLLASMLPASQPEPEDSGPQSEGACQDDGESQDKGKGKGSESGKSQRKKQPAEQGDESGSDSGSAQAGQSPEKGSSQSGDEHGAEPEGDSEHQGNRQDSGKSGDGQESSTSDPASASDGDQAQDTGTHGQSPQGDPSDSGESSSAQESGQGDQASPPGSNEPGSDSGDSPADAQASGEGAPGAGSGQSGTAGSQHSGAARSDGAGNPGASQASPDDAAPAQPDSRPGSSGEDAQDDDPQATGLSAEQIEQLEQLLGASLREAGSGELADALVAALTGRDPEECLTDPAEPDAVIVAGSGAGSNWDLRLRRAQDNLAESSRLEHIARPIAVRLGSRLDELLVAQTHAAVEFRRSGTRLESTLLASVVTEGRLDVFRRTDEIEAIDTAVLLLTDISASMSAGLGGGVSAIEAADATTRALGDTLDRFDIPFAVRYFGEALTLGKSFEEPWRGAKHRHWARLEGSTCTHQALYTCVPEIAARDELRKLLILVTDGVPSDSETTAVVLMEAMRAGIQPAVVLIAAQQSGPTASFAHLLRHCGVAVAWAQDPQSLSQVVFDAVKETLTDSRRKLRAA